MSNSVKAFVNGAAHRSHDRLRRVPRAGALRHRRASASPEGMSANDIIMIQATNSERIGNVWATRPWVAIDRRDGARTYIWVPHKE